jgi:hypothetical protein
MKKFMMAVVLSAWASIAFAQTPPPATPPAAPPSAKPAPKAKAAPVVHSPESIECSKQADAKGLHGKPRQTFRANCIKGMKKKS